MAHYLKDDHASTIKLIESATMLMDNDHSEYDGSTYKSARETSPFQKGLIVWADTEGYEAAPRKVLVVGADIKWSERAYEYIDHVVGLVERKDGSWGKMYRHISRGDITRGYAKARDLGLHPAAEVSK